MPQNIKSGREENEILRISYLITVITLPQNNVQKNKVKIAKIGDQNFNINTYEIDAEMFEQVYLTVQIN